MSAKDPQKLRTLSLRVENPQIKINGILFDLKLSDMEIYARAMEFFEKYEHYPIKQKKPAEILADVKDLAGFIEEILGEGAIRKISGGRPVGAQLALEWLGEIAKNAAESFAHEAAE